MDHSTLRASWGIPATLIVGLTWWGLSACSSDGARAPDTGAPVDAAETGRDVDTPPILDTSADACEAEACGDTERCSGAGCGGSDTGADTEPLADTAPEEDTSTPRVKFRQISAGNAHACGVTEALKIRCWGAWERFAKDQIPYGTMEQVSASGRFDCALNSAGIADCWGDSNFEGRLQPPTDEKGNPIGGMINIDVGENHVCGVRDSGEVLCWGLGSEEDKDEGFADFDQAVPPKGNFRKVAVGYAHTCALGRGKQIECWGQGSDPNKEEPGNDYDQAVAPKGTFFDIDAGRHRNCAIRSDDRSIHCWGRVGGPSKYGKPPEGRFRQIAVGKTHACGVHVDGTAVCWGKGGAGELDVPDGTWKQIVAGTRYSCGLRDSGVVECWGANGQKQADPP